MLTDFPLTQIDAVVRRTLRSCVIVAALAIAAAVTLGYPLVAPGVVLGLALAVGNHRLFQATALRYTTPEGTVARKPFAGTTLVRLGVATAVALVLLVFEPPVGWGVIGGLVAFQALLLLNAVVALLAYQRQQAGPGSADDV